MTTGSSSNVNSSSQEEGIPPPPPPPPPPPSAAYPPPPPHAPSTPYAHPPYPNYPPPPPVYYHPHPYVHSSPTMPTSPYVPSLDQKSAAAAAVTGTNSTVDPTTPSKHIESSSSSASKRNTTTTTTAVDASPAMSTTMNPSPIALTSSSIKQEESPASTHSQVPPPPPPQHTIPLPTHHHKHHPPPPYPYAYHPHPYPYAVPSPPRHDPSASGFYPYYSPPVGSNTSTTSTAGNHGASTASTTTSGYPMIRYGGWGNQQPQHHPHPHHHIPYHRQPSAPSSIPPRPPTGNGSTPSQTILGGSSSGAFSHHHKTPGKATASSSVLRRPHPTENHNPNTTKYHTTSTTTASINNKNETTRVQSPTEIEKGHREDVEHMGCTCKKTRCLKLYCQCFGIKLYCGTNCRCLNCYNNTKYETVRQEAMRNILSRNPSAFDTKFRKVGGQEDPAEENPETVLSPSNDDSNNITVTDGTAAAAAAAATSTTASSQSTATKVIYHKLGCKCRKSGCMKKYCECYAGNVKCNASCRCIGCQNLGTNDYREAPPENMAIPYHSLPTASIMHVPSLPPRPYVPQSHMAPSRTAAAAAATAESWHAVQSLTFLKRGSPSSTDSPTVRPFLGSTLRPSPVTQPSPPQQKRRLTTKSERMIHSMPSLASSSDGTSPGDLRHPSKYTFATSPSKDDDDFVEQSGSDALMLAATAMTEFAKSPPPSISRSPADSFFMTTPAQNRLQHHSFDELTSSKRTIEFSESNVLKPSAIKRTKAAP